MFSQKLNKPIALVAAAIVVGGGAYGIVAATAGNSSGSATTAPSPSATSVPVFGRGGSNARSGPAAGGSLGTVGTVSKSSFTLTTAAGQSATVKKVASTTYKKGTKKTSANAVKRGATVLVLGTTNGTTITAGQVIVQPNMSAGSATFPVTAVVPFQRGAASTSMQDGQVPATYSQGSGTIVSGTKANKATEAALAVYPGGIIDRVVKLSGGEYEVHNIGVNWPHHIFVDQSFKVIGAN
ncbi:MAG: hypothetical protein QOK34_893 [Gaiellaceae bacterium]|jgi:hypothetical protein|nr:hypothetical protein [Gaiellaceae bacterium]